MFWKVLKRHHGFAMNQADNKQTFKTFWKVLKTDLDFVMKQGLRIHLKGLRPRMEMVD